MQSTTPATRRSAYSVHNARALRVKNAARQRQHAAQSGELHSTPPQSGVAKLTPNTTAQPARRSRFGARLWLTSAAAFLCVIAMLLPAPHITAWLASLRPPSATPAPTLQGTTLDGVPAPAFQLQDQHGQTISLASLRGQPVVLTFFDSVCPHTDCSLMAQYLEWGAQFLGADSSHVAWVALSVNPWHDTPESAQAFLTTHSVTLPLHYLLGSVSTMSMLWSAYHMEAILQSDGIVVHSTGVYLLDKQGDERVFLDEGFDPKVFSADLKILLAEGSAPATSSAALAKQSAGTSQSQVVGGDIITLVASPGQYGTYALAVTLRDGHGAPISGATVSANLIMTDMAMQPEQVTLAPDSTTAGRYSAQGIVTMVGRWQATLRIQLPSRPQALPGLPSTPSAPLTATFQFTAKY
jgi:protein SCO1/2